MHATQIKNIYYWMLAAPLFLYICGFFLLPSSKQNTLFYLSSLISLLVLIKIAYSYKPEFKLSNIKTAYIFIFSYLIFTLLSCFWSTSEEINITAIAKDLLLLTILFFSVNHLKVFFKSVPAQRLFLFLIISSATLTASLTIAQLDISSISERLTHYSLFAKTGNPINTATYFGFAIICCIFAIKLIKNKLLACLLLGLMALFFSLSFLTQSRTAIIAMLAVATLSIILLFESKKNRYILGLFFLIISSLSLALYFEKIADRITDSNHRLDIWRVSFKQISEHFLLGLGYGEHNFPLPNVESISITHAHNLVIESLRIVGVPINLVFIAANIMIVLRAMNVYRHTKDPSILFFLAWYIYGVLCLMTNGRFIIRKPSYEWFCYWLPFAFLVAEYSHSFKTKE